MNRLYHITPKKNINSIKIKGILPGFSQGMTSGTSWKEKIFLTDNPRKIAENQCGDNWINKYHPRVLDLDVTGLDVRAQLAWCHNDGLPRICENEFFVFENIEPHRILKIYVLENFINWKGKI